MATSSIEKNFSISTEDSAMLIANQIIDSENGRLPDGHQKYMTENLTLEKNHAYAERNSRYERNQ